MESFPATVVRNLAERCMGQPGGIPGGVTAPSRCWKSHTPLNSDTARIGVLREVSQILGLGVGLME